MQNLPSSMIHANLIYARSTYPVRLPWSMETVQFFPLDKEPIGPLAECKLGLAPNGCLVITRGEEIVVVPAAMLVCYMKQSRIEVPE